MKAYVGLGSNLGDREQQIRAAIEQIALLPGTQLVQGSSLYDTQPVGELDQPNFLNAVAVFETELDPKSFLWNLLLIERRLGRVRRADRRYGPRTIDLDLLFHGDTVVDEPGLQLPHPEIARRAFVLVPLAEVDPHLVHPSLGVPVSTLLARVEPRPTVRRTSKLW